MVNANAEAVKAARDFKKKASKRYGIKKIFLFGSHATGTAGKDSDIDLLIVSDKAIKKSDFMTKMLEEWHIIQKKKYAVDFLCFTSREFKRKLKGITIVRQAVREGIAI